DVQHFDVQIRFKGGKVVEVRNEGLNLFDETIQVNAYSNKGDWIRVRFNTDDIIETATEMKIDGEKVDLLMDEDNTEIKQGAEVESVTLTHHQEAGVNYRFAF